jgi:hypothetical protein
MQGITFLQASVIIFETTGSLLFALEINPTDLKPRVILNPADMVIPDCEEYNVFAIVIAQDKDAAGTF